MCQIRPGPYDAQSEHARDKQRRQSIWPFALIWRRRGLVGECTL